MNGLYAPTLDAGLVDAMAEAGFSALNLSLCTTHPGTLRRFRRPDLREAVARALKLGQSRGMDAVTYILVGAPGQRALDAVDDLLFLAALPTLVGVSVFYPAPGSVEYRRAEAASGLPGTFAAMRSSALPMSDTTTRRESATLLRLGRILNFMKHLRSRGVPLWDAPPARPGDCIDETDREALGRRLLAAFGQDGLIPGITPDGRVYAHATVGSLVATFSDQMARCQVVAPGVSPSGIDAWK